MFMRIPYDQHTSALNRTGAVNVMLSVIGEAPVNTITGALTVDVIQAKAILNQVSREVQSGVGTSIWRKSIPWYPTSMGKSS